MAEAEVEGSNKVDAEVQAKGGFFKNCMSFFSMSVYSCTSLGHLLSDIGNSSMICVVFFKHGLDSLSLKT
jgi:hypothetical protein